MAKRFTLGKKERLKSRKQIEQLFREGRSISVQPFRVYYIVNDKSVSKTRSNASHLQSGFGVSGKNFKRAVDRNRIKRLIREAYRLQKLHLQEKLAERNLILNVFFIFTGKEMPDYKLVENKVGVILKKLFKLVDENPVANS